MAETNSCSLPNMLNAILSVANTEQNQSLSPSVFTSQYNTVVSMLLSKVADMYPSDSSVLDIADPYVKRKVIPVKNGYIDLPDDYRNILGSPMIASTEDGCKECEQEVVTENEFNQLILKAGCKKVALLIVDQAEFGFRTTSTYKRPTYDKPIGYRSGYTTINGNPVGQIKVCPFDIKAVELMYLKKEKPVNYGYITQPDDTFVYDPLTSVDTEFTSAAFSPIFSALLSLYTAYTRDNQLKDWALFINQNKLI